MAPADYQRLSQDHNPEERLLDEHSQRGRLLRSPAQYDGSFDPSDSENEDGGLLQKEHPSTPGIAEQGFEDQPFSKLIVGVSDPFLT